MKIPDLIVKSLHLKAGEDIEISIHSEPAFAQGDLWEDEPEEISQISLDISEDLHTLNMYNRVYIPEKYRFFFPPSGKDFILSTNVGEIKTHVTTNGYFTKGVRAWVQVNGPLQPTDKVLIRLLDEKRGVYEMEIENN